MFKLPDTPSPKAHAHELADYAEWKCWRDNSASVVGLLKDLGRIGENDYSGGVPEEEETSIVVEEAYREIERRKEGCQSGYPFVIGSKGYTLRAEQDSDNPRHVIYKYLLMATRLDMQADKNHAQIDGTHLLEELAAEVAQSYFGSRASKYVFGTSSGAPSFPEKVNELCDQLKEGIRFDSRPQTKTNQRDGKLDIVAWIPFTDNLPGQFIAFGQCKTGTTYEEAFPQLRPENFCKKWLYPQPVFTPIRMFFVAEALPRLNWDHAGIEAGLLFDRCRIVDYSFDLSIDLMERITSWTDAAYESKTDA